MDNKNLELALKIAGSTIGFELASKKAMNEEEYKEWAKNHQKILPNGHMVINADKIN